MQPKEWRLRVAECKCHESVRSHHLGGPAYHQVSGERRYESRRCALESELSHRKSKGVGGGTIDGRDGGEWERGEVSEKQSDERGVFERRQRTPRSAGVRRAQIVVLHPRCRQDRCSAGQDAVFCPIPREEGMRIDSREFGCLSVDFLHLLCLVGCSVLKVTDSARHDKVEDTTALPEPDPNQMQVNEITSKSGSLRPFAVTASQRSVKGRRRRGSMCYKQSPTLSIAVSGRRISRQLVN